MNIIDGTYSTPQASSPLRWIAFTPDNQHVAFEQDFWVAKASYTTKADVLTPGTPYTPQPPASDFWLASERSEEIGDGSLLKLVRTYAKKPTSYDIWESFAMTFPSIIYASGYIRPALNLSVVSRVNYEFFLVIASEYGDVSSVAEIAILPKYSPTFTVGPITIKTAGCDTTTDPTADGYTSDIIGTEQIAADSELAQWYGPIYLRKTRYVTMQ